MAKAKSKSVKKVAKKGVFVAVGWDIYDRYWDCASGNTSNEAVKNLHYNGDHTDIHVLDVSGLPQQAAVSKISKTIKVIV